jgi:TonB family protein
MKLSLSPLLILLFIAIKSFSQQTKEVVEKSGSKFNKEKKVYYVLKENNTVKHGPYKHYYNGNLAVTGFYKQDKKDSVWQRNDSRGSIVSKKIYTENKRTGIWEFFNKDGSPAQQYDFSKETFQIQEPDTVYSYQVANGEWIKGHANGGPVWLRSTYEWISYLNITLRYPQDAIDHEKQGAVAVDVWVDENGNAVDYTVEKSVYPALDEESIRVVKLFQPEFLPAEKDGKKVKSKIRVYIIFKMEF